jgi:hypothetical protein
MLSHPDFQKQVSYGSRQILVIEERIKIARNTDRHGKTPRKMIGLFSSLIMPEAKKVIILRDCI